MPLRNVVESDWTEILRVANEGLPQATDENVTWMKNRRECDESIRRRRQHVALDADRRIVGDCAVEQSDDPARFRAFVVTSPDRLSAGVGDVLLAELLRDSHELGAAVLWMRERADDHAIMEFARAHDFAETQRFTFGGIELIMMESPLNLAERRSGDGHQT